MALPQSAWIVSHTHWDREWYATFHTFRVRLAACVKRILAQIESEPAYRHFMLDGQAILLEDYLEIHPEDEARIREHVQSGRLAIGPWYILPDEFLVGAEPLVRNALVGHQVCEQFGGGLRAGYMPDTFGHVAQVPQLLRGIGLDSFIYWRGNGAEIDDLGLEYEWVAPDGSRVLAIQQCDGYCNAGGLGLADIWEAHTQRTVDPQRAVEQVGRLFEKMSERGGCRVALINNGCDHFPPQANFTAVLEALRAEWPEVAFQHGSLAEFLDDVRSQPVDRKSFRGEMLSGKLAHILSGIWSARMYLKQQNAQCQSLLSEKWEPLAAYHHFMHDLPYPSGLLNYSWKLLLKNHPHDSIGGCSIDRVHEDMLPRFAGVLETGQDSLARQFDALAPHFARDAKDDEQVVLLVANPTPERRSAVVERLVILTPECAALEPLAVVDHNGREVPSRIVDTWHVERLWGVDYRTQLNSAEQFEQFEAFCESYGHRILKQPGDEGLNDRFVRLQFHAEDLPAVGHRNYRLVKRAAGTPAELNVQPVRCDGNRIANEFVSVQLKGDGTFDLVDLRSGLEYRGLNLLVDQADRGDEYDFDGFEDETRPRADPDERVETAAATDLRASLEVRAGIVLPALVRNDRVTRAKWAPKLCGLGVRATLDAGCPWVVLEVDFENRVRDHRLRVHFPAPFETDQLISDGHFHTHVRPLQRDPGEDFVQPDPPTWPQQNFSAISDGRHGLALFNEGLPEIEGWSADGQTTMALTLLRCVGWLSRDDFASRRNQNAGPMLATPGAQCRGQQRFRYAVMPFSGDPQKQPLVSQARAWRCPPLTWQGVADQSREGVEEGLVSLDSNKAAITAIKKHEERNTLVVRLYALTDQRSEITLRFGRTLEQAWRTNLLEDREQELPVDPNHLRVELKGQEIATVEVAFQG